MEITHVFAFAASVSALIVGIFLKWTTQVVALREHKRHAKFTVRLQSGSEVERVVEVSGPEQLNAILMRDLLDARTDPADRTSERFPR